MTIAPEAPTTPKVPTFLELEITRNCQLTCPSLCYAQAGPTEDHGTLSAADWKRLISEAAVLGVEKVQFIGGEPTRHPAFAELVSHALTEGLDVQVYSNLYRVKLEHWRLFARPRVSLATSYHSDDPDEHDRVTGRKGSHEATRANIVEALRRNIPLQVGIVRVFDGQRVDEAHAELAALGVKAINSDDVRGVGRAAKAPIPSTTDLSTADPSTADPSTADPSTAELCGNCARGRAAIMPDGQVTPCVLGRFLPAGDAKRQGLAAVFASPKWAEVAAAIPPRTVGGCTPDEDSCMPSPGAAEGACTPADSNDCDPSRTPACNPKYS